MMDHGIAINDPFLARRQDTTTGTLLLATSSPSSMTAPSHTPTLSFSPPSAALTGSASTPTSTQSTAEQAISMLLTPDQQVVISSVERAGAGLSLVGVLLVFVAFAAFKRLRTVPNIFILCASVANVGASVACLIGYAGIMAGDDSALCQAQAFLLEMFMQSDPWWSLAMAVNVYLVFFRAANPTSFRRSLWVYCLVCFGLPAIPAVVLLVWQRAASQEVFGNATLWCWIDDPQSSLRIWSYYLPIWVCILVSALIYVAVGYHVFHHRNQLRNMTLSTQGGKDVSSSSEIRASAEKSGGGCCGTRSSSMQAMTNNSSSSKTNCYGTVTTTVTTEVLHIRTAVEHEHGHEHELQHPDLSSGSPPGTPAPSIGPPNQPITPLDHQLHPWQSPTETLVACAANSPPTTKTTLACAPAVPAPTVLARAPTSAFTISSISSSPRPGSHAHGHAHSHLHHHHHRKRHDPTATHTRSTTRTRAKTRSCIRRAAACFLPTLLLARFRRRLRRLDPVKLAYLRTSFVFALSVLVTWTPSSINRVYALTSPEANYALNLASAVVLPLQGVWNAVIFFTTSWRVLRGELGGVGRRFGFGFGFGAGAGRRRTRGARRLPWGGWWGRTRKGGAEEIDDGGSEPNCDGVCRCEGPFGPGSGFGCDGGMGLAATKLRRTGTGLAIPGGCAAVREDGGWPLAADEAMGLAMEGHDDAEGDEDDEDDDDDDGAMDLDLDEEERRRARKARRRMGLGMARDVEVELGLGGCCYVSPARRGSGGCGACGGCRGLGGGDAFGGGGREARDGRDGREGRRPPPACVRVMKDACL